MRSRLRLTVIATFVLGLVLTALSAVVAKSPEERDQIDAADRIAERFQDRLDQYVRSAANKIQSQLEADQDGYPQLLKVVDGAIDDAPRPRPEGTTAYGREHSDYADIGNRRKAALAPFEDLRTYLEDHAIPDSRFLAAGRKLVTLRPGTLLGKDPVLSGEPLRDKVLPAYEKARARLKKQKPPKGSELLQLDLKTYADDVIAMTKDGAKKIDEQEAFFFKLGDRPVELFQRLATIESAIQVQVARQVELVAGAQ